MYKCFAFDHLVLVFGVLFCKTDFSTVVRRLSGVWKRRRRRRRKGPRSFQPINLL
jgi:hypothetical protein